MRPRHQCTCGSGAPRSIRGRVRPAIMQIAAVFARPIMEMSNPSTSLCLSMPARTGVESTCKREQSGVPSVARRHKRACKRVADIPPLLSLSLPLISQSPGGQRLACNFCHLENETFWLRQTSSHHLQLSDDSRGWHLSYRAHLWHARTHARTLFLSLSHLSF